MCPKYFNLAITAKVSMECLGLICLITDDFIEVTMITLKKKPKATKCSDHRTISIIAHAAKIVARILRRTIERKIEDIAGMTFSLVTFNNSICMLSHPGALL
jgi:hypothetical protein